MAKLTRVVERSTAGLRTALFDALDDLNAGKRSAQDVVAVTRAASAIVESIRIEVEFYRHVSRGQNGQRADTVLALE